MHYSFTSAGSICKNLIYLFYKISLVDVLYCFLLQLRQSLVYFASYFVIIFLHFALTIKREFSWFCLWWMFCNTKDDLICSHLLYAFYSLSTWAMKPWLSSLSLHKQQCEFQFKCDWFAFAVPPTNFHAC